MNNPEIRKFLSKHDPAEWDTILEDLILYGISKIKEIEKEEQAERELKEKNSKKFLNQGPNIVSFKSGGGEPFEYSMNYLLQAAELKSNPKMRKKTENRLNQLSQQLNNINKGGSKKPRK